MAKTVTFGFTNTTDQTNAIIQGKKLSLFTDYDVNERDSTPDNKILSNTTCPSDKKEYVSIKTQEIARVDNNLKLENPSPIKNCIQYSIQLQETATITDTDTNVTYQEPIVITTTIRHKQNAVITGSVIDTLMDRHISAFYDNSGNQRFDQFMRGAETPKAD